MTSPPPAEGLMTARVQRPVPLREGVYEALLDLITRRHLPPGRHLVESELAEHLGVSRQPVREALHRLNMEGWVDLRPGYGAFVHSPTAEEAEQLFAVRALLETESARLAARNATEAGLARLRALVEEGMAAVGAGEGERAVEANAELHRVITEMSGNAVLAELVMRVSRRVRWYHASVVDQRGRSSWEEHAGIIDAIASGAEDKAGELMRRHTERTRRMYLDELARGSAGTPSR